jgi:hypothetical protein
MNIQTYKRNCPKCGSEILYKIKKFYEIANKKNTCCRKCCVIGKGFTGKKHDEKTKKQIHNKLIGKNNPMYGRQHSYRIRKKISENMPDQTGLNNHFYGKHHSEKTKIKLRKIHIGNTYSLGLKRSIEAKRKMRVSAIKRIERDKNNGNQIFPNFNSNAISIIENYGKEHGYDFQHAMNGGEYFISELGYWVDGYDREKNVIIEYYENRHKYTMERDVQRKHEIINFLKCDFIELKEWELTGEIDVKRHS